MPPIVVVSNHGGLFTPMDPAGKEFFYWDFTKNLKPGETVLSAVIVSNSMIDGADNSAAMVVGDSLVMNGTVVRQMIAGGTSGIPYRLTAVATTSLGQEIPLSGILPIGPDFGVVT